MKKHLAYYVSFLLILAGGFYLFTTSAGDKNLALSFVILLAVSYVIWGILHHLVHHSMTLRIVIEYAVVASLGVAIIFFILNGGL